MSMFERSFLVVVIAPALALALACTEPAGADSAVKGGLAPSTGSTSKITPTQEQQKPAGDAQEDIAAPDKLTPTEQNLKPAGDAQEDLVAPNSVPTKIVAEPVVTPETVR